MIGDNNNIFSEDENRLQHALETNDDSLLETIDPRGIDNDQLEYQLFTHPLQTFRTWARENIHEPEERVTQLAHLFRDIRLAGEIIAEFGSDFFFDPNAQESDIAFYRDIIADNPNSEIYPSLGPLPGKSISLILLALEEPRLTRQDVEKALDELNNYDGYWYPEFDDAVEVLERWLENH
jgi:hypothetical protein